MSLCKNSSFRKLPVISAFFALALVLSHTTQGAEAGGDNGATSNAPAQRIVTPSGLQYEDIKVGTGPEAKAGMKVTVHYTGWLKSRDGSTGKKFDSSRDRDEPFRFPLGMGQVIQGWDEGVQGMRVGGVRRLIVPSALGYGMRGAGSAIPPNATLLFEIELLGI